MYVKLNMKNYFFSEIKNQNICPKMNLKKLFSLSLKRNNQLKEYTRKLILLFNAEKSAVPA